MNPNRFSASKILFQYWKAKPKTRANFRRDKALVNRSMVVERLEVRTLLAALSDDAYQLLRERTTANQEVFYVYQNAASAFNHGETTKFSSETSNPITLVEIEANCVFDLNSPDGCATDRNTLDRDRGTVLRIDVAPLASGQFAGVAIKGTVNVPTGQDLRGATQLVFEAHTSNSNGQPVSIDIGGSRVTTTIPGGNAFTTLSIPLTLLQGANVKLTNLATLFAVGVSDAQGANRVQVFFDNIRYEATPFRQQTELGLPLSNETFGIIPETRETIGDQHPVYPLDQVLVNTATVYESSMTAMSLLLRGQQQDLKDARRIVDTFVYALGHDLLDNSQIPPSADGAGTPRRVSGG